MRATNPNHTGKTMDLTAAINRISEMSGQFSDPEILTIPHSNGEDKLSFVITRDAQGGMVTKDVTKDLERFDDHPLRREGTAVMGNLDSLIAHVNRFKTPESALFGERVGNNEVLKITGVIDYHDRVNKPEEDKCPDDLPMHPDANPQHCKHRVTHEFPLSDEIKAWTKVAKNPLDLLSFALFLEDNILDVLPLPDFLSSETEPESNSDKNLKELVYKLDGKPCGYRKLMELSKGIQINEGSKSQTFINKDTGEQQIGFESEHEDAEGNKLEVPNMFLIAIPIFEGGAVYRIPVRLRYRKNRGDLVWLIEPYQLDRYIKDAFTEACADAAGFTGLPLFFGQPET
ncbi:DUF2303 family protein [Cohaesibacter celericrescens]|uniref:DUF2303 domain-containing protein n=1 Tax=Cohaesibacter celericrescens TaxID=2067669 RepID=A0A2N5XXE6_9HYPH|nr:DUF2303 family protein [Cohaesibacter celericrescens]PLW79098.1 hypothetical protein C0081_02375 [Cohaesibacter celericrescens]